MASNITLSAGVRQNLLSLQNTASLMSTTQNRLATGKKVNTALDNPTNFFTSSSLQSRANDLNALLDSMSNGIKTLETADNGLTAITKAVESMQSTLRQARQDKSFETASYTVTTIDPSAAGKLTFAGGAFDTDTDFDLTTTGAGQYAKTSAAYVAPSAAAASALTGTVDVTSVGPVPGGTLTINYGGKSVAVAITGGAAAGTLDDSIVTDITNGLAGTALDGVITASTDGAHVILTATGQNDARITVTDDAGGVADAIFGATAGNKTGSQGSDGLTEFTVNGVEVLLDGTTGATVTTAVDAINAALTAAGESFQAYDAGGKLGIRATTTDAGALAIGGADAGLFGTPSASGTVAGTTSAALTLAKSVDDLVTSINNDSALKGKVKASNDGGKLRIQNLSTQELTVKGANSSGQITGTSSVESTIKGNDVRKNLVKQFNDLRDQLNKLSDDASFNGINLLRGDKLKLTFNETGTSTIEIQAKDTAGNVRGIDTSDESLNIDELMDTDVDSDDNIDGWLDGLATSLSVIRAQASSFGSNLSIVQNRQDFTKAMITTLETGADNLVLADSNEEAANMLALQTRQQLASTALSLASQADQSVLRLFG